MFLCDIMLQDPVTITICVAAVMFIVIGGLSFASHLYSLNGIKSKPVTQSLPLILSVGSFYAPKRGENAWMGAIKAGATCGI
ncbi:MAG: hypothetical protein RR413_07735 [Christensenellaceae bacterium]